MNQIIDMRSMRYLNLFGKITGIRTKNCFSYNNFLVFAVPPALVSKAIGENGKNVREISSILGKRVKVIAYPRNNLELRKFFYELVAPVAFKSFEVTPEEIVISASTQNKAVLIGRNKVRLQELSKIMRELFSRSIRIV